MGKYNEWLGKQEALLTKIGGTTMADAILRNDLQVKLEPTYLGLGRVSSIEAASKILGVRGLFVSAQESYKYLQRTQSRAKINYTRDTLIRCVAENEEGIARWGLIYCPGLSLMDFAERYWPNFFRLNLSNHITPAKQQEFISHVANQRHEPGYYLVNLLPAPLGVQQTPNDLVTGTKPAPFPIVVNAIIMVFRKYATGIPHWPVVFRSELGPDESRVVFGLERSHSEFRVNFLRPDYDDLHQQNSTQVMQYKPWDEFKES